MPAKHHARKGSFKQALPVDHIPFSNYHTKKHHARKGSFKQALPVDHIPFSDYHTKKQPSPWTSTLYDGVGGFVVAFPRWTVGGGGGEGHPACITGVLISRQLKEGAHALDCMYQFNRPVSQRSRYRVFQTCVTDLEGWWYLRCHHLR